MLSQERAQRMAAVKLVAAVAGDEQQALAAQVADQVAEQVAGRAVGPVHVLDHDDRGRVGAEPAEHPEHQLEQPLLAEPGRRGRHAQRRLQRREGRACGTQHRVERVRRELVGELAHDARERRIGNRFSRFGAVAGQHARPGGARPPGELRQQPGLADPGLAADERRARSAGGCRGERGLEDPQLVRATDEHGARDAGRHIAIIDQARGHRAPQLRGSPRRAPRGSVAASGAPRYPSVRGRRPVATYVSTGKTTRSSSV